MGPFEGSREDTVWLRGVFAMQDAASPLRPRKSEFGRPSAHNWQAVCTTSVHRARITELEMEELVWSMSTALMGHLSILARLLAPEDQVDLGAG